MQRALLRMLKGVPTVSVCVACAVCGAGRAWAWDVEHDEIAQLVGESLPAEIKAFFDFDDFATLMGFCHFPDMTEWEPRRSSSRRWRRRPRNGRNERPPAGVFSSSARISQNFKKSPLTGGGGHDLYYLSRASPGGGARGRPETGGLKRTT